MSVVTLPSPPALSASRPSVSPLSSTFPPNVVTSSARCHLHEHLSADALVMDLGVRLHAACARALAHRGHALLSLAGGRTPLPIYRQLASATDLDWEDVALIPGDERCVAHTHPASNLAALRAAFAVATGVRIAALTAPDGDVAASLAHARATLSLHTDVFDAVVLGMGEDAHTASLFPGAGALPRAMDPVAREDVFLLHPDPLPAEAPFPRITLGLARLLRARTIHVVVTGERKRAVLEQAMSVYDPLSLPISAVLHAGHDVHVHWSP